MIFQQFLLLTILFYLPFVLIVPTIALFIVFLRDYFKTKQKMFKFIAFLFFNYLLYHFFSMSQIMVDTPESAVFNFLLSQIFEMLVLYSLILVLEVFEKNIQFSGRQTILTILIFTAIGGMINKPDLQIEHVNGSYVVAFERFSLIVLFQILFYTIASIWLILMLYRSRKASWSPKQKRFITLLFIGVVFAILLPLFPVVIEESLESRPIYINIAVKLIQEIMQNSGMLIIGFAFLIISKKPWLLQRQKVYLLVIYSREGIALYSKAFSKDITSDDMLLLAGVFSAVSSLIKEVTKTSGDVNAIMLEGKELRILNRETFLCALLVEYSTQASEMAHEKFTLEFEEKFLNELRNFTGEVTIFEPAEEIAMQYFS